MRQAQPFCTLEKHNKLDRSFKSVGACHEKKDRNARSVLFLFGGFFSLQNRLSARFIKRREPTKMEETIKFEVPLTPYGKGRPRFSTFNGHVRTYTPANTRAHENTFKIYARQAMAGRYPFEKGTSIAIKVSAFFPVPKSYSRSKRLACESNVIKHMVKPDVDNVVKAVLDAMNDCVYFDDSQVYKIEVEKRYTDRPDGYYLVEVTHD